MSLYSMPFLILNLGGEMLYILSNRLAAQKVESKKVETIFNDLVLNLFNENFLNELFRPQPLYSLGATFRVFSSASETSMMRLSSNSMQKLYDLMRMGFKFQLQSLSHPLEVVEWTLNHIEGVMQLAPQQTQPSLQNLRARVFALHKRLNVGEYARIRADLLNFTLGFRVKVSIFLKERIQRTDGTLVIPQPSELPPSPAYETPGTIRAFKGGKPMGVSTFPTDAHAPTRYPRQLTPETWNCLDPRTRLCRLGFNVYSGQDALQAQTQENVFAKAAVAPDGASTQLEGYKNEMNYLSQLAGRVRATATDKFQLNIFADDDDVYAASPHQPSAPAAPKQLALAPQASPPPPAAPQQPLQTAPRPAPAAPPAPKQVVDVVKVDADAHRQQNKALIGIAGDLGSNDARSKGADVNDLLDLMDQL